MKNFKYKEILALVLCATCVLSISSTSLAANKFSKHIERVKKSEAVFREAKKKEIIARRVPINDVYVVQFILDGLNLKAFQKALDDGNMPNVKRVFYDGGTVFSKATSLFPSVSTNVYQSFSSGLLPGHAGIPHLQRFDRTTHEPIDYLTLADHDKVNGDLINLRALYDPASGNLYRKTSIFELLDGYPTAAVYSTFYKGASEVLPGLPIAAMWELFVSGKEENLDVLALEDVLELYGREEDAIPRYSLVGLYSSDVIGHKRGPHSKEVQEVLGQFDAFLADFVELLKKRGIYDKTYIVLSSDHGMHDTSKIYRLERELGSKDFYLKPNNPKDKKYSLVVSDRGVASAQIYVRHDGGFEPIGSAKALRSVETRWGENEDLIGSLLDIKGTAFVLVRDGHRGSVLFDADGRSAKISCYSVNFEKYCRYSPEGAKGDPFNYESVPELAKLMDGRPHHEREWLSASVDSEYPDAVYGMSQIFRDGRAGDAFAIAKPEYGIRKLKKGNHGNIFADDMRVVLMVAGPKVPARTMRESRPTDVNAMVIDWFGLKDPGHSTDGVNPLSSQRAVSASGQKIAALEDVLVNHPPIDRIVDVGNFVAKNIYPVAKPSEFPALYEAAQREAMLRSKQLKAVSGYLAKLEKQNVADEADKVVADDRLHDAIAITKLSQKDLRERVLRIDDVVKILRSCRSASSVSCSAL